MTSTGEAVAAVTEVLNRAHSYLSTQSLAKDIVAAIHACDSPASTSAHRGGGRGACQACLGGHDLDQNGKVSTHRARGSATETCGGSRLLPLWRLSPHD